VEKQQVFKIINRDGFHFNQNNKLKAPMNKNHPLNLNQYLTNHKPRLWLQISMFQCKD
jgi:hypothetical protein